MSRVFRLVAMVVLCLAGITGCKSLTCNAPPRLRQCRQHSAAADPGWTRGARYTGRGSRCRSSVHRAGRGPVPRGVSTIRLRISRSASAAIFRRAIVLNLRNPTRELRAGCAFGTLRALNSCGEMAERSKALDWNSSKPATVSWVRIPLISATRDFHGSPHRRRRDDPP